MQVFFKMLLKMQFIYFFILDIQWNLSNPTHQGDQGNVSDCTGCRNTQVLFILTELLWDHKFLSDGTGCQENSGVGLHRFHCI